MENPYRHSVVQEFSILFTSRVFQKSKCWFDGTLRYFEVNGKLEISNEQGSVISIDFVNKPPNVVLSTILAPEKVFKLSNNALLLEIISLTNSYERDVSCINVRTSLQVNNEGTGLIQSEGKETSNATITSNKFSMKPIGTFDNYKVDILESSRISTTTKEQPVNNDASVELDKCILQNLKGASPDGSTSICSKKVRKPVYRNQLSRRHKEGHCVLQNI
jgi:hypothetical protein